MRPMTTDLLLSSETSEWSPEATYDMSSVPRSNDREVYFQTNIYRPYRSSADENPFLKFIWNIFQECGEKGRYRNDWLDWVLSLKHATTGLPLAELRDLGKDLAFLSRYKQQWVIEQESVEKELVVHDRRVQGLTMDWKRARELYRKLLAE